MAYSRFSVGAAVRIVFFCLTVAIVAWMTVNTQAYLTIAILVAAALAQMTLLMRFVTQSSREMASFLDAICVDDTSLSFSRLRRDVVYRELGEAMARVVERLRVSRAEREEQSRYLQSLLAHVPVALISTDGTGRVQLLNVAARRLFETPLATVAQFARHGTAFSVGMESLRPGSTGILRMERGSGSLLLKAAATELELGGVCRRLFSLQNIESEMSAQEMVAWQNVIRVMAHEVMNSLTPVSSLSATAHDLVHDVLEQLPADDPRAATLNDARDALETVARRSAGLLHFVQNHRRLTKRLVTRLDLVPMHRVFARLQYLLASDLASRNIQMTARVVPETLEISVDAELLDQALINLVRNAIEALQATPDARIALSARRDANGQVLIAVEDNGPGIAPDQLDKVFVPFFTTKRQGSGVGLTLVKQIATAHGATVVVSQTPGGGATVSLRF